MIKRKAYPRGAEDQRSREKRFKPSVSLSLCFSALILFLAFFLRFHNLGAQSFWNDEGSSYVQATRSFADIAANAARDIHPPGYYWLLAIWRQFVGDSEFALRSLSAFASVLTVAFTYALGKRLFNPAAGLAAALFVALNTFSIYYAQEARMYALLALWGVMGMWALTGLLKTYSRETEKQWDKDPFHPSNPSSSPFSGLVFSLSRAVSTPGGATRWAISLALINAAGLYTQYAYPFVMLAQGAIFLIWLITGLLKSPRLFTHHSSLITHYFFSNLLTILLYLPWLPTALQQVTQWPSTGAPIPAGEALGTIVGWSIFEMSYDQTPGMTTRNLAFVAWLALMLLVGGVGKWNIRRGQSTLWRVMMPILWIVVPIGLFLALGLFRPANLKFLLPSQIAFALFLGLCLTRIWEGFSGKLAHLLIDTRRISALEFSRLMAGILTLVLVIVQAAAISPLYDSPSFQRPDYRTMVRQITADPRPGDAVILDAPNQEEVFRYYYKGDAPVYPLPPGLGGNDAETAALTQDIIRRHDRIFVLFWGEAERDPNHIVETTLDSQTFQAGIDQWYGDVRFAVYVTPADMPDLIPSGVRFGDSITLAGYALSATALQPGDVLQVRLDWQMDTPLDTPYKVFLQLLNSDGVLVTQRDSEPNSGSSPTNAWTPGETVTDRHGLTLPADLPSGSYQLIVGMYNRDDAAARLPVDGGDYLELATITIR